MANTIKSEYIIKKKYKIEKILGQGSFGEIYQSKILETLEDVAIKIERIDAKNQMLRQEASILKRLQDSPYVCRFIAFGRVPEEKFNYLVMELLGENFSSLRRKQPNGRFTLKTTLKLGKQMLSAIETVHKVGYIHRDIKPSNFAIGIKRKIAYLIDFGLAKKYVRSNGEMREGKHNAGFRGTARYASIQAHFGKTLDRKDDLWSLLYSLIEFAKGSLPWRKLKNKEDIRDMKIEYNGPRLVEDLPYEFLLFLQHLQTLQYGSTPDYGFLHTLLDRVYQKLSKMEEIIFAEVPYPSEEIIKKESSIKSNTNTDTGKSISKNNTNLTSSNISFQSSEVVQTRHSFSFKKIIQEKTATLSLLKRKKRETKEIIKEGKNLNKTRREEDEESVYVFYQD